VRRSAQQADLLTALAGEAAATGNIEAAEVLARAIRNRVRQAVALIGCARILAAKETELAVSLVRSIRSPKEQSVAIGALAEVIAADGDATRAWELIRSIERPDWQARALIRLLDASRGEIGPR
jgi:hypothetical protein